MKVFKSSILTKSMFERSASRLGIIGTLAIIAILAFAFTFKSIPFLSGQSSFHAEFADASGLNTDDPVNIAGVTVGKVRKIELDGTHVNVEFGVDDGGQEQLGGRPRRRSRSERCWGSATSSWSPAAAGGSSAAPPSR